MQPSVFLCFHTVNESDGDEIAGQKIEVRKINSKKFCRITGRCRCPMFDKFSPNSRHLSSIRY